MALALEIQKAGWKGAYVKEYMAVGEVPETVRNAFMQKSRWCKGGMQIFFSKHNAMLAPNISIMQKVSAWLHALLGHVSLLSWHVRIRPYGHESAKQTHTCMQACACGCMCQHAFAYAKNPGHVCDLQAVTLHLPASCTSKSDA